MTHFSFFVKDGTVNRIIVKGHANAAPKGEDIVCAAVSALVQNLSVGFGVCGFEVDEKTEDGSYKVSLTEEQAEQAFLLTESLMISSFAIAEAYPDFVTVGVF